MVLYIATSLLTYYFRFVVFQFSISFCWRLSLASLFTARSDIFRRSRCRRGASLRLFIFRFSVDFYRFSVNINRAIALSTALSTSQRTAEPAASSLSRRLRFKTSPGSSLITTNRRSVVLTAYACSRRCRLLRNLSHLSLLLFDGLLYRFPGLLLFSLLLDH